MSSKKLDSCEQSYEEGINPDIVEFTALENEIGLTIRRIVESDSQRDVIDPPECREHVLRDIRIFLLEFRARRPHYREKYDSKMDAFFEKDALILERCNSPVSRENILNKLVGYCMDDGTVVDQKQVEQALDKLICDAVMSAVASKIFSNITKNNGNLCQ